MRPHRSSNKRLMALILALGLTGCARDSGIIAPIDVPFSPPDVANSIHSLRFAADNIALVQVGLITDALGLTTPGFSAAPRRYEREKVSRGEIAPSFRPGTFQDLVKKRTVRLSLGAQAVPLFPINFLGATFRWDAGIDGYVLDESLGGAPHNGVRFILYRLDAGLRIPALPLAPFGHVDLFDESNAESTRLRVVAFDDIGSVPLANYIVDGAFGSVSTGIVVNLLSSGFVADHSGRFDFELDETLETDNRRDVTYAALRHRVISDEGSETLLTVDGEIANDGSYSDLGFVWDIVGPAGATTADLRVLDGAQDGTISHGGRTEVYVTGSVQLPDYTRPGGGGFGPNDVAALDEILFGIDDVLILSDELFRPLGEIFGVR